MTESHFQLCMSITTAWDLSGQAWEALTRQTPSSRRDLIAAVCDQALDRFHEGYRLVEAGDFESAVAKFQECSRLERSIRDPEPGMPDDIQLHRGSHLACLLVMQHLGIGCAV